MPAWNWLNLASTVVKYSKRCYFHSAVSWGPRIIWYVLKSHFALKLVMCYSTNGKWAGWTEIQIWMRADISLLVDCFCLIYYVRYSLALVRTYIHLITGYTGTKTYIMFSLWLDYWTIGFLRSKQSYFLDMHVRIAEPNGSTYPAAFPNAQFKMLYCTRALVIKHCISLLVTWLLENGFWSKNKSVT